MIDGLRCEGSFGLQVAITVLVSSVCARVSNPTRTSVPLGERCRLFRLYCRETNECVASKSH